MPPSSGNGSGYWGHESDTDQNGVTSAEERAAWAAANPGRDYMTGWGGASRGDSNPFNGISNPTIDPTAEAKRKALMDQAAAAGGFAGVGEQGYANMSAESQRAREQLARYASGQDSLSAEQLRQGLQQNMSAQRSMAASASPQNAAMAARTAANNMSRSSYGMSGQAAMAGIAERKAANESLANMIMQQRQQDAQVALGSRQNAVGAYGGTTPQGSAMDRWGSAIAGGVGAAAKLSDRRLKTNIADGDDKAREALKVIKPYTFEYTDERHGQGEQLGPMAQDLEAAGLGHLVIDTPTGKMVDGAAAALTCLALVASLATRVEQLEAKGNE